MVPHDGNNGTELVMSGGSQTQSTTIPKWLEDAARENIATGNQVAGLGYVPYFGADVASFTPMQQASFQNTGQAANAFGLAGGGLTGMEGMPQPQQFAGGVSGYSSAPMFQETMAALEANNPAQFAAIQNMFNNPQTGAGGNQPGMQMQQQPMQQPFGGNRDDGGSFNSGYGGGGGGFTSFGDMFDGGGAGAPGGSFSGGGLMSSIGNAANSAFGGGSNSGKKGK
jgi:hypothetical protein